MAKVLVLYYSSYGHIETMAGAIAEGARSAGAEVHVKRVPELMAREAAEKAAKEAAEREAAELAAAEAKAAAEAAALAAKEAVEGCQGATTPALCLAPLVRGSTSTRRR